IGTDHDQVCLPILGLINDHFPWIPRLYNCANSETMRRQRRSDELDKFFGSFHRCTTNVATNLRSWVQPRLFRFNDRDNANEAAGRPVMREDSIHHIDRIARSIYSHEYPHFDSKSNNWRYAPDQGTQPATETFAGRSSSFSQQ